MSDMSRKELLAELKALLFSGLDQRLDLDAIRLQPRVQELIMLLYLEEGMVARAQRDVLRGFIQEEEDETGARKYTYLQMGIDFPEDSTEVPNQADRNPFYASAELIRNTPQYRQAVLKRGSAFLVGCVKGMVGLDKPDRLELSDIIHTFIAQRIARVGQLALAFDDTAKGLDKLGDEAGAEDRPAASGDYPKR